MISALMPSLSARAAVRIVVLIWYNEGVLTEGRRILDYVVKPVEEKVASNISKLPVSKSVHQMLFSLIRPVGEQIREWVKNNARFPLSNVDLHEEIHWTSFGLIDYSITADNILNHNFLHPRTAFELACFNGAGSHACRLWHEAQPYILDEKKKEVILNMNMEIGVWIVLMVKDFQCCPPVNIDSIKMNFFVQGFKRAWESRMQTTIKFYFQHLNPSRQKKIIQEFFVHPEDHMRAGSFQTAPLLPVFFTSMDEAEMEAFFLRNPVLVLIYFLEWPLREFFMVAFEKVKSHINKFVCFTILRDIVTKIMAYEYEVTLYKSLFKNVWFRISLECQDHFISEWAGVILTDLFSPHALNRALATIFMDDRAEEKIKLLFRYNIDHMIYFLTEDNKQAAFKRIVKGFIPHSKFDEKYFDYAYYTLTHDYFKNYYRVHNTLEYLSSKVFQYP